MKHLFLTLLFIPTLAFAGNPLTEGTADLVIGGRIENLTDLPSQEAFAECTRMSLACHGSCIIATPAELVYGCTEHMLCCRWAAPYMDAGFDETLPLIQPSSGALKFYEDDGLDVYE